MYAWLLNYYWYSESALVMSYMGNIQTISFFSVTSFLVFELHENSKEKRGWFCLQVCFSYWNMVQLTIVLVYCRLCVRWWGRHFGFWGHLEIFPWGSAEKKTHTDAYATINKLWVWGLNKVYRFSQNDCIMLLFYKLLTLICTNGSVSTLPFDLSIVK